MKTSEKRELLEEVLDKAKPISSRTKDIHRFIVDGKFGLCQNCEHLMAAETNCGTVFARCEIFNRNLNAFDPIKKCSNYWNTSMPTIRELLPMAVLLETKKPVGFIPDDYPWREFEDETPDDD